MMKDDRMIENVAVLFLNENEMNVPALDLHKKEIIREEQVSQLDLWIFYENFVRILSGEIISKFAQRVTKEFSGDERKYGHIFVR